MKRGVRRFRAFSLYFLSLAFPLYGALLLSIYTEKRVRDLGEREREV